MPAVAASRLRDRARALGFDDVGTCAFEPTPRDAEAYRRWLAAGMAGTMAYMARADRVARALDPRLSMPGARGLIVVARHYAPPVRDDRASHDASRGVIAAYACGPDYHDVMRARLEQLGVWLANALGRAVARHAMVDSGPLLERDAAARAGLGFVGRNTMLIHPRRGSWSFLGVLFSDAEVDGADATAPDLRRATCGSCRRCLDACPTGAITTPYVLDARRCISYLTIEHRGVIPPDLRASLGNRVFGCDACGEVCPYNRRTTAPAPSRADSPTIDPAPPLLELLEMDEGAFAARYAGTAVQRARRKGLVRNACVAAGNWGDAVVVPALLGALGDVEPLVRGHAAWALGRIGDASARPALSTARAREPDPWVRDEMARSLDGAGVAR